MRLEELVAMLRKFNFINLKIEANPNSFSNKEVGNFYPNPIDSLSYPILSL